MSAALRQRLVLEAPVEAPDGAGGVVRSFAEIAHLWAAVTPLAMAELVDAERALGRITHRVRLRARADLTTAHRFRHQRRVLRIAAVRVADAAGRFVECLVVEERP